MPTNNKPLIGVIGAMKPEIDALKAKLCDTTVTAVSGVEFVRGTLDGVEVIAAVCGIGKVFAALCAQALILTFHPDLVVNIGVAGSTSPELNIGDIAVADSVVQHDMDTSPLGDPLGLISGINIINFPCAAPYVTLFENACDSLGLHRQTGVIASGDCFVHSSAKKAFLQENFNAIACEMEGGAIGHVCYVNGTPFCVIRAMSDNGDESSDRDYTDSLQRASDAALDVMFAFLRKI